MLEVTPHINSENRITLDIHNEVSDLSSQATVQGGVIINTSPSPTPACWWRTARPPSSAA